MMIDLGSVSLHVVIEGPEDAPVVTFSNSLMTDTRLWENQARYLSDRYRVIRYDQRGHGQSTVSADAYQFDMLANDIVRLWDYLQIERSHLVGISMGGMTSLGLALTFPERLSSCVMCSMRADAPAAFVHSWDERIAMAKAHGMGSLAEPTVSRWFPEGFDETNARALVRDMVATTSLDGFLGGVSAICGLDYFDRVADLAVPVLYLAGSKDGVLPGAMQELANRTASSMFEIFEGAGHLINLEQPSEFNLVMGDFVAKHS